MFKKISQFFLYPSFSKRKKWYSEMFFNLPLLLHRTRMHSSFKYYVLFHSPEVPSRGKEDENVGEEVHKQDLEYCSF